MNRLHAFLAPLAPERRQHLRLACWGLLISWTAAFLLACSSTPNQPLFEQLGGVSRLEQISNRTVNRAAMDPRTKRSFQGVKLSALRPSLAAHLCHVADGPCRYEGETMAHAHAQSHITASEFDAMVSILREELDRDHVPEAAKNELLRRLAPMRRDIVQAP